MTQRKWIVMALAMLVLAALLPVSLAENSPFAAVQLVEQSEQGVLGSYVSYPQLVDPQQRASIEDVNAAIVQNAQIEDYLRVLEGVTEGSVGVKVRYDALLQNGLLSLVISAEGKMPQGRPSQKYYAMMFDLETGEQISFDQLFEDSTAALEHIEEMMDGQVSEIVSTYMENNQLTPVPTENVAILHDALVFCYDNDQLSFLSGDSGAVSFWLSELAPYLDTSENGIPARLTTYNRAHIKDDEQRAQTIVNVFTNDMMPGLETREDVDLRIGAEIAPLTEVLRQTTDSGFYPGGAFIEVEDAFLRNSYLLTDESETMLTGILCKRLDLYGIVTGQTTQSQWRAILGQPTSTITLDAATAESYLLSPGQSDDYQYSERTLTLHADENGVLQAIILK